MKPSQGRSSVLSVMTDHVAFGLVGVSVFLFVVPMTLPRRTSNLFVWDPSAGLRQAFMTLLVGFLVGVASSVCLRMACRTDGER